MSVDELELVVSSEEKTLVKLGAKWCGPCLLADRVLKKVVEDGYSRVVSIDVEEDKEIATLLKIKNMPTFIIYQKGEVLERFIGRVTKEKLINKLK